MICPVWMECIKKSCIENERCCNPEYWARLSTHVKKTQDKLNKKKYKDNGSGCVRTADGCDKWDTCSFMNECLMKIPRIRFRPALLQALSGPHSMKEIVNILRIIDPSPMRSYYFTAKPKKCSPKKKKQPTAS